MRFICRLCGIEGVYPAVSAEISPKLALLLAQVIGPLELDGEVLVAAVVRLDGLNHGHGGNVLDKHHGARDGEVSGMVDDDRVDEHPRGCDPDVVPTTASRNLGSGGNCEASWKLGHELGVSGTISIE